ncbi:hypothetical protein F5Y13DRAFT_205269 [Hypoxylon sp. FL1857]|nr:hypothetical protein F5Y13DRAFT_205269 [Hypoxylon sp. FL1857]
MLENQRTSDENISEIHLLCEDVHERMINADDVADWQNRAHEADMKIHTQELQIQGLQDDLNQMCIRTNEQCKEREDLKKELAGLQNAAANEQTANQKIHGLTEQVERLQRLLNEKDIRITKINENLEAAQEKLRSQASVLQDREKQIQNEQEQHEKALELNMQQHKQAITQAIDKETQELRAKHQATEKQLQETDMARAQLEGELTNARQDAEASSKKNVEDLRQFGGEIIAAIASVTELTRRLEESEGEREGLRGSLEDWSRKRADIDQIQLMLGRLARDQPNAIQMSNQLKELLQIHKSLAGTLENHQVEPTNLGATIVSSQEQQHGETNTQPERNSDLGENQCIAAAHPQEKLETPKRKVMVKSPVNEDDHVFPLSVEEERSTRRQSAPPRGIMKVGHHSTLGELEAAHGKTSSMDAQGPLAPQVPSKRRIAKRGSNPLFTTHSMYNRPVAGSVLESNMDQVDSGRASSNEHRSDATLDGITSSPGISDTSANSLYEGVEIDSIDEPPMKRQRTFEVGQQRSQELHGTQKTKLSRSMSTYFPGQTPEGVETFEARPSGPRTLSSRGGPIERRSSGLMTYSSQSSVVRRSHNQSFITSNPENLSRHGNQNVRWALFEAYY